MRPVLGPPDIDVVVRVKNPYLSARAVRALIIHAARAVKLTHAFAVSVQFVGPVRSRALNKQWRGKDKPTNVLSFAAREGSGPLMNEAVEDLGDIVLCPLIAKREAPQFEVSVRDHLARLVVHGFLHLLGHDHEKDSEARSMEQLEWKIVRNTSI